MGGIKRIHLTWHFIWLPLLAYLSYVMYQLALFDSLSSIANDSVNYLAMARHYSPWVGESEAISRVWPLQDFPPLFPVLLALTGVAHSLLYAHLLVVLLGFSSLYFLYRLASSLLGGRTGAAGVVILFALSPGYLLGLQGILSETLYLLLSLMFLVYYQQDSLLSRRAIVGLGLLLAAILLTRTIGYALFAAVIAQKLIAYLPRKKMPWATVKVAAIGLGGYLSLMWLIGPDRESHYLSIIENLVAGNEGGLGLKGNIHQLQSILDAWQSYWTIYWTQELSVTYIAVLSLLALSLTEWAFRLKANKIDAWYVCFYLFILAIWPHPGQMVRLLFPLAPILMIYAFKMTLRGASLFSDRKKFNLAMLFMYGILVASIFPAHAFIHGRLALAESNGMVPVYEIFRRPDIVNAKRDLFIQNQMLEDFAVLGRQVDDNEKILYYMPSYPAVLGNQIAEKSAYPVHDESYRELANRAGTKFILLTEFHPRKTRQGISGFDGADNLHSWTRKVWCSYSEQTKEEVSCLYQIAD